MYNYVTGYSYPLFKIRDISTNALIDTIELDLCMSPGGLTEEYSEDFKRVELYDGTLKTYDVRGCRIIFSLDYASYVRADNLFLIEQIFSYASQPELYKIQLYPRYDNRVRFFDVMLLDGAYSLGLLPGGSNTQGHKLPVIKFITTELVSKNFTDITFSYVPLPLKSE